jgi:hypothetical protein
MTEPNAFAHVLMTRFNLPTAGRESKLRDRPGWLAERFSIFERICLPSVAAQTCRAFDWIIYFDEETPDAFRERIAACQKIFPFHAYFTGLFPASGWPRSIRETLAPDAPLLLSTRLDNDDAISCDFIERVHASVRADGARPACHNFRNGFVVGGGRVYRLAHPANPFMSRLEAWAGSDPHTAMGTHHLEIARHGPVRQIEGPAAWVQFVHGGNVSNTLRGRLTDPCELAGRFPAAVAGSVRAPGRLERWLDRLLLAPARRARDTLSSLRQGGLPAPR